MSATTRLSRVQKNIGISVARGGRVLSFRLGPAYIVGIPLKLEKAGIPTTIATVVNDSLFSIAKGLRREARAYPIRC